MASITLLSIAELVLALLASGVLAGLLVGLFGAYGGLVIVPVLHPILTSIGVQGGLIVALAAGVSLALVAFTGVRFWRGHFGSRQYSVSSDDPAQAHLVRTCGSHWPVSAAAVAASVLIASLPRPEIQLIFAFALVVGAVKMLFLPRVPSVVVGGGVAVAAPQIMAQVGGFGFGRGCMTAAMLGRRSDAETLSAHLLQMGATVAGFGQKAARMAASPLVVCLLLALPAVAALPQIMLGNLVVSSSEYGNALGVGIILLAALLLAPVGAELSRQFSKRVLEVSLGLFLLLAAGQFAFLMP